MLTFKIGASAAMPALALRPESAIVPEMELSLDPEWIANGKGLFEWRCERCHGVAGASQGAMPNLQEASRATKISPSSCKRRVPSCEYYRVSER